jgi:hypothetical protein
VEIALRLSISANTVKSYLGEIFDGLRMTRRQELRDWCLEHADAITAGEWAAITRHPRGCPCKAAYCALVRSLPLDLVA